MDLCFRIQRESINHFYSLALAFKSINLPFFSQIITSNRMLDSTEDVKLIRQSCDGWTIGLPVVIAQKAGLF